MLLTRCTRLSMSGGWCYVSGKCAGSSGLTGYLSQYPTYSVLSLFNCQNYGLPAFGAFDDNAVCFIIHILVRDSRPASGGGVAYSPMVAGGTLNGLQLLLFRFTPRGIYNQDKPPLILPFRFQNTLDSVFWKKKRKRSTVVPILWPVHNRAQLFQTYQRGPGRYVVNL